MSEGESREEYAQRAGQSLNDARADAFALVTFQGAVAFGEAQSALGFAARVDAVIFPSLPPRAVPEPVAGETRADVFGREAARARQAFPQAAVADQLAGAVVFGAGDELRRVAQSPFVATVEVLPPGAVWGAFGIAPVA
ncbi:hypothetical protein [Corynebacterium capitovis]|uniref:hypothetical protein n=1 Tax=Corynebacterium capitovis TaxID=131081 RepID=UPI0012E9FA41|nr:hypothetical protein [Corynebacterium capitovis]